jgi:hypothetical protein
MKFLPKKYNYLVQKLETCQIILNLPPEIKEKEVHGTLRLIISSHASDMRLDWEIFVGFRT